MDPTAYPPSTYPLHHSPYGPILPSSLTSKNTGKVALVTGAARGIGAAIAESLAQSGATLALLDLELAALEDTCRACKRYGGRVEAYACDVSREEEVVRVCREVEGEGEGGVGAVDILVNNAGILVQRPLLMSDFASFWKQIEVNFKGPLLTIHTLLPRMRDRGHGCIINIASRSATVDVPMTLGYVSSKAALARATHTLQLEMELDGLDPGIHMYALHPGGVRTGMGGAGAPSDVREKYGDVEDEAFFEGLFKDGPELCGQTCAWLATGEGRELRGLYIDCRQDVRRLLEKGREGLLKERRNVLTVNFLEGYENEP